MCDEVVRLLPRNSKELVRERRFMFKNQYPALFKFEEEQFWKEQERVETKNRRAASGKIRTEM